MRIGSLPEQSAFNKLVIYDSKQGDEDEICSNIEAMTKKFMEENPQTGAIVLECQNFAPYGSLIQEISGVPVFGINQLIAFMESAVCYPQY